MNSAENLSGKNRSATILLTEDDPAILYIITRMLQSAGYDVLTASNGAEALQSLENHETITLLITDIIMDEMNGRELAEHVDKQWPHIGVLFISGYAKESLIRQGLINEQSALLTKPFDKDELVSAVELLLQSQEICS